MVIMWPTGLTPWKTLEHSLLPDKVAERYHGKNKKSEEDKQQEEVTAWEHLANLEAMKNKQLQLKCTIILWCFTDW